MPTKEELLWRFEELTTNAVRFSDSALQGERVEIDNSIRKLIEERPRVTEEFVERWASIFEDTSGDFLKGHLGYMLQEAGVEATASEKEDG